MAVSRAVLPPVERRPRPIDLNLLPADLRRPPIANPTSVLALLAVCGVLFAVLVFQFRLRADDDVQRWQARLIRSQNTQATLATGETQAQEIQGKIAAAQQKLDVMQGDYQDVALRRVSWSLVYQTILSAAPPDMGLGSIQQKNFQILLQGTGSSYASITRFADLLNGSGLFASVQIQAINEAPPGSGVTPIDSGPAPSVTAQPGTPTAAPTTVPTVAPTAPPAPTPAVTVLPPVGATTTPATTVPTPSSDFVVADKIGVSYPGTADRASVIRGKVVDENNNPIPNIKVVLTGCCPQTTVEQTAKDGTFEFVVDKKGTYSLALAGVKSETATGLNTNFPSFTGYHVYDVVFRRGAARRPPGNGRPIPPPIPRSIAARPNEATFAFTIIMQVKPGAGQVPSGPAPARTPTR